MPSRLNKSVVCFCNGKINDYNIYDDSYTLRYNKVCHYCSLNQKCNYFDIKGNDNRRCFRYLSNGTEYDCILYSSADIYTRSRQGDLLFNSRKI